MKYRLLLAICLFVAFAAQGQKTLSDARWDTIEVLMTKGSYTTADQQAAQLFAQGVQEHSSRDILTGAWYLARIGFGYRENSADSALRRYQEVLPLLDSVDLALCHLLLADFYHSYYISHSWTIDQMEETDQEVLDYKLWPTSRFRTAIRTHLEQAQNCAALLQRTPIATVRRFCFVSDSLSPLSTPTVYDLVMSHAQQITLDGQQEQLRLLQLQRQFHEADADDMVRVLLDLQLLDFVKPLTLADLRPHLERYSTSTCPQVAQFYSLAAEWLERQHRYVEAISYCDTAMARFAGSQGALQCECLRRQIVQPRVEVRLEGTSMPGADMLGVASYKNTGTLYFRVVKKDLKTASTQDMRRAHYLQQKAVQQWNQTVPRNNTHATDTCYIYLPSLPAGEYVLLASPNRDFSRDGFTMCEFACCDAIMVLADQDDYISGYMVSRTTGQSLAGQQVWLEKDDKVVTSALTQEDGSFRIRYTWRDKNYFYGAVKAKYQGVTFSQWTSYTSGYKGGDTRISAFFDRPVYRPGDTLSFSLIVYGPDADRQWNVLPQCPLVAKLTSPNGELIDTMGLTADRFGSAHGRIVLPAGMMPGPCRFFVKVKDVPEWKIKKGQTWATVKVEEYKQPKFKVALSCDAPQGGWHLGDSVLLTGAAISYSGVPVNGARVHYRVERTYWFPRCYWKAGYPVLIASGDAVTDAQGAFDIGFAALPDTSLSAADAPLYQYQIIAAVTDLNGETHEQRTTLRLGSQNSLLQLHLDDELATWDSLRFSYTSLDEKPLPGSVQVRIEQLQPPAQPHLRHRLAVKGLPHSMGQADFEKRFPLIGYHDTDFDPQAWPVRRQVLAATAHPSADSRVTAMAMPPLEAGVYRVTLLSDDGNQTLHTVTLQPSEGQKVVSQSLFWSRVDSTVVHVGSQLCLSIGSRYRQVPVRYMVLAGGEVLQRGVCTLSDSMAQVAIPITDSCLGGITVCLFAVKENITLNQTHLIEVPYSHKMLHLQFESFRDRLQPGQRQTWTLKVRPALPAAAMLTLYDASLDSYGTPYFNLFPWENHRYTEDFTFCGSLYAKPWYQPTPVCKGYQGPMPQAWTLMGSSIVYGGKGRPLYSMAAKSANGTRNQAVLDMGDAMVEEELVEEEAMLDRADLSATATPTADPYQVDETLVRHNLSTLGFFIPQLICDSAGQASFTFTAPELLTQWNLRALAWTPSLSTGTLLCQTVTLKDLSVQPNVPRFLRQGDQAQFMAKVSNMGTQPQEVTVSFVLSDAQTGAVVHKADRTVQVPAQGSAAVSFAFNVPLQLNAATYRIVAKGSACSDGEQGALAVLPNRQLVTESLSMYINGAGVKHCTLPHLQQSGKSATLQHRQLALECTSNPLWYAVQALPYVQVGQNPSSIYRFNAYFANALSAHIEQSNPAIAQVFAQWLQDTAAFQSPLQRNADLKQTLLDETPWLSQGDDEQQQRRQLAQYFDTRQLALDQAQNLKLLLRQQRADGGWSWLPDALQTNLYVTQYLLKGFGELKKLGALQPSGSLATALDKALRYVDAETYDYYLKYEKKHPRANAENIDYLYLRSFYPQASFASHSREAYEYYYANALNNLDVPRSLYSSAQLALVFYRHGDVQAARHMVGRLKESSLRSDELGMYWRDNAGGYLWYQRPVEVQSLIIQAFAEVTPDDVESLGLMQQWLLKQKQTTCWNSDAATAKAVAALLCGTAPLQPAQDEDFTVEVGGTPVQASRQAGTGFIAQRWDGAQVTPRQGKVTLRKRTPGIAWGALYWQYFENLDKVPYSQMGVRMQRLLFCVASDGTLRQYRQGTPLKVGDKVRVRLLIDCDRTLEYLELKDSRAACLEPVSTRSGWSWNSGLSYYAAVRNASNAYYIDRLEKGKYILEYDYWVTAPGSYLTGLTTLQCLYAPEFRTTLPADRLQVEE